MDPPQYPGEDTRPTSKKELAGFYLYGWAAEVFVVCGMGSFVPITLEQLARSRGVLLSDGQTPCEPSMTPPAVPESSANSSPFLELFARRATPDVDQCVVRILGTEVNTASFALYVFSISVAVQAILIVSVSGAADHGRFRKSFLLGFGFAGAIATMLFLPVGSSMILIAALLAILSNTCFGASWVLLNSFLPLLVRHHPDIHAANEAEQQAREQDETTRPLVHVEDEEVEEAEDEAADTSTAALLPSTTSPPTTSDRSKTSLELNIGTHISALGIGIGYTAAILVQTLCILLVARVAPPLLALRLALFLIGAWWFLFTIPSALLLRPRPGPPLHLPFRTHHDPTNAFTRFRRRVRLVWTYVTLSWKSLFATLLRARALFDLLLFLFAWFLLSDSIATTSGTAILFAKTTLDLPASQIALISILSTLCGIFGAAFWPFLARRLDLSPTTTLIICNAIFLLIPLYGLSYYVPFVRNAGLGLQSAGEVFALACVYGLQLGGISTHTRALYAELIPPGSEAAFFALYAITDKGSSVLGPLVVGAVTDRFGGIRPAFVFLAVLVAAPLPMWWAVDVERGRRRAWEVAGEVEGKEVVGRRRRVVEEGGEEDGEDGEDGRIRMVDEEDEEENSG
ncbi:MFS general substrate transporter [Eremomyces bilateralis CBS 781.70]|uniref:Autophagy-related protein n=1 Tax=Eremomyces bilateralis CBS 781.70 TaxID=1392243 RepID=A0A6G1FZR5_9PEZI|nr:MFS general substrate transporter [Eremomyces bilateralis CBS 781.70]KAF1811268.1 MFS general substrate transporter [Eremomyces bilateralis CBS 781.70]